MILKQLRLLPILSVPLVLAIYVALFVSGLIVVRPPEAPPGSFIQQWAIHAAWSGFLCVAIHYVLVLILIGTENVKSALVVAMLAPICIIYGILDVFGVIAYNGMVQAGQTTGPVWIWFNCALWSFVLLFTLYAQLIVCVIAQSAQAWYKRRKEGFYGSGYDTEMR